MYNGSYSFVTLTPASGTLGSKMSLGLPFHCYKSLYHQPLVPSLTTVPILFQECTERH